MSADAAEEEATVIEGGRKKWRGKAPYSYRRGGRRSRRRFLVSLSLSFSSVGLSGRPTTNERASEWREEREGDTQNI